LAVDIKVLARLARTGMTWLYLSKVTAIVE